MKVALYNSHLRTLGGGEQHALAIVHWLLDHGHSVDVLARPGITIEACEERLGIGLGGARMVEVAERPIRADEEATERSSEYDLFVNATYGSGARSLARRSVMLVYFPVPPDDIPLPPLEAQLAGPGHPRHQATGWIMNDHGLYDPEDGGAWSDGRASYQVRLSWPGAAWVRATLGSPRPEGVPEAEARFVLDGRELARQPLPREGLVTVDVLLPSARTTGHRHRLDIVTDRFNLADLGLGDDRRDLGAFVTNVELSCGNHPNDLVEYAWRLRWLDTYDLLLANSHYTERWIRRYWGQPAQVLYPPVTPPSGRPARDRANTIVSLGRFFEGSHSKKQLELVRAFDDLCDAGLEGWTFHVMGGAGDDGWEYFEKVRKAAAGYPVDVVANAPRAEVESRLGEAALFWQATGWGEDRELHPERFEHFGIALVEAMGAGAVPVVIDGGAASEVVRDGRDGLLWPAGEGPGPATRTLAADPRRRAHVSRRARRRAASYSPAAFDRRLTRVLRGLA